MPAAHVHVYLAELLAVLQSGKGGKSTAEGQLGGGDIVALVQAEGDDLHGGIFHHNTAVFIVAVDDEHAVLVDIMGEFETADAGEDKKVNYEITSLGGTNFANYKIEDGKKLDGVCGGIAEYFNIDPTLVRLVWALVTLCTVGVGLIGYLICAVIMPKKFEVIG